jgi:hypothetical protein
MAALQNAVNHIMRMLAAEASTSVVGPRRSDPAVRGPGFSEGVLAGQGQFGIDGVGVAGIAP